MDNIPSELIWAHILPQLDINSYLDLFRKARDDNDHNFILNYIIQSYKFIYPDDIIDSCENSVLMEEIVLYSIKYLTEIDLFDLINTINFPYLCIWPSIDTSKYWNAIIKRNNINILQFFICCQNCAWDALFSAIDNNNENLIKFIINNGYKECMFFRHYLKIIILCNDSLWNYLLDLLKDELFRLNTFNEANIYNNFIYNSLLVNDVNDINNIINISYDEIYYDLSIAIKPNNKHAKKIKKKLRRLQKILKCPGLVNIIASYFDKICDIELNLYNPYDDEEYTDY